MKVHADIYNRKQLILLGAGGHARVLLDLIQLLNYEVIGVCDPILDESGHSTWSGINVLGADDAITKFNPLDIFLVNGVGQVSKSSLRSDIYKKMRKTGFGFQTLVHPFTSIASSAELGNGVQIMAGAIVQNKVQIGDNTIINTASSIDHDSYIGSNVHIAPGVRICGGVDIQNNCIIGAGAVVLPGSKLPEGTFVKSGSIIKEGQFFNYGS